MSRNKLFKTVALGSFQWLGVIIFLVTGFGCMAPKLKPLSQEIKEEFKIYNDSDLKNIKYKRLGIVESFYCKRMFWDLPPNYKNGVADLTYKAQLLGGNALINLKCQTKGTGLGENCLKYIQCVAAAILRL